MPDVVNHYPKAFKSTHTQQRHITLLRKIQLIGRFIAFSLDVKKLLSWIVTVSAGDVIFRVLSPSRNILLQIFFEKPGNCFTRCALFKNIMAVSGKQYLTGLLAFAELVTARSFGCIVLPVITIPLQC